MYKRQGIDNPLDAAVVAAGEHAGLATTGYSKIDEIPYDFCLLYTSDAADERSSVDLGGRRIIKKKNIDELCSIDHTDTKQQRHTSV